MSEARKLDEIVSALSAPIPGEFLATRRQGGQELVYIPWYRAQQLLDRLAPGWHGTVRNVTTVGGRVTLTYAISIPTADFGLVTREATGSEELAMNGYGDPSSNAESMAFRRAAARWGLGLYLYEKDTGAGRSAPASSARSAAPSRSGGTAVATRRGPATVPFGTKDAPAGTLLSEIDDGLLDWYGKTIMASLEDQSKEQYRERNTASLRELKAEVTRRRGAGGSTNNAAEDEYEEFEA